MSLKNQMILTDSAKTPKVKTRVKAGVKVNIKL